MLRLYLFRSIFHLTRISIKIFVSLTQIYFFYVSMESIVANYTSPNRELFGDYSGWRSCQFPTDSNLCSRNGILSLVIKCKKLNTYSYMSNIRVSIYIFLVFENKVRANWLRPFCVSALSQLMIIKGQLLAFNFCAGLCILMPNRRMESRTAYLRAS